MSGCHGQPMSQVNPRKRDLETTISAGNNNNRDQFLRHLNKLSHKISKPSSLNLPPSNLASSGSNSNASTFRKPPNEPPLPPPVHPPQQQPPVYNINKSDFRDVVQKLTGSPAHAAAPAPPPPIHAPKPASSRLQRIRPPPLAQLSPRPPSMLGCGVNPHSPLPPLPTCHAAAESPISAYMRFLHSSVDSSFNRTGQMLPPPSPPSTDFSTALPPFGFLPSPKSPFPFVPPNMMFSPTGNSPLGFPISPTVPGVPSPK
uniref:VQ domain-containing protein n=1 Tax=Chenopodium quinoa TaxID=63459 RepID=A0A803MEB0_CHEQI